jgi:hypothetical protein
MTKDLALLVGPDQKWLTTFTLFGSGSSSASTST